MSKTLPFVFFLLCLALSEADQPNILYIMSDDHAAHAISAYGGRLAEVAPTPQLDRLAREGMRFTNAFVTNSICTPSRAILWTGKYSHFNGVYKFTGLDQSQPTLPKYMQAHGYQTGFVGKYHLHTNPVGFDHWSILPGQGKYHDTEFVEMGDEHPSGVVRQGKKTANPGWHSTDIITHKALEWFNNHRNPDQPFFYMLHYKAPHDLWEHAHRYDDYLADVEIPEPDNLFDHGSGRSPALDQSLQNIASSQRHMKFTPEIRAMKPGFEKRRFVYQEYMKRYLRCVKGIDDNLGKVFDYLDEWELYNLRSDPKEMDNLVNHPAWSGRLAALKSQLTQLQNKVDDNPNDTGDHPRTGNATLDQLERDRLARQRIK